MFNHKKFTGFVRPEDAGIRLDVWLSKNAQISKSIAREHIIKGSVYLNHKRVRIASKKMIVGAQILAHLDLKKTVKRELENLIQISLDDIVYEDDFLIVVNKPAGIPTQPTVDEARNNLVAALKKYLTHRDQAPNPYLGVHHRLDSETSGVILFSKKKAANAGLSKVFQERLIEKTYLALVFVLDRNKFKKNWVVKNFLGKGGRRFGKQYFKSVKSGGDYAETSFELLETKNNLALIRAYPKTGRTHQIRIHLSEEGLPIVGDLLYGTQDQISSSRLMLHALEIKLKHPITQQILTLKAPVPPVFYSLTGLDISHKD